MSRFCRGVPLNIFDRSEIKPTIFNEACHISACVDTELFIMEIEKEECLWKTNSKEYMVDRYAKAKAWVNIASRVFNEWDGFNKEEQELKCKLIKFCL
ncbi:Uncharacterized protein FWK35_00019827 [Aphis craccivora]|uniref:MADF domain-containing protein n=1 Tax=Aphis craccivora TaxID=307492 RepID=A0A6G0XZQ1_APHCR|nr:Uncharacterized protein FWK35_00019827 [Aphis craccivora]